MTRTIYKAGCVSACLWLISSSANAGIKASGGEFRILDGQYAVHTFTNSSRMVIKEGGLIDILSAAAVAAAADLPAPLQKADEEGAASS